MRKTLRIKAAHSLVLFVTLWLAQQPCGIAFSVLPLVATKRGNRDSHCNSTRDSIALWFQLWEKNTSSSSASSSSSSSSRNKKDDTKRFVNVTIVGIDDNAEKPKRYRRKHLSEGFEARRAAWEAKYGSAEALRRTFGGCKNSLWGDLDGEATRELYHTLLPRSLLALQEADILQPEELAPLAYQARVAAKEYARKRSRLPSRLLAMAFDSYRSWQRDGNPLNTKGLSWEDLWDKYEAQIVQEECNSELKQGNKCLLDGEALTKRIYRRILERSCATNQAFDRMFLNNNINKKTAFGNRSNNNNSSKTEMGDLATIAKQLDQDVRELLLRPDERKKMWKSTLKAEKERIKAERKETKETEKADKKESKEKRKLEKAEQKKIARQLKKEEKEIEAMLALQLQDDEKEQEEDKDDDEEEVDDETKRAQYKVLRIAANARRKLRET